MKLEKFYTILNSTSVNKEIERKRNLKFECEKIETVQVEKCFYVSLKKDLSLVENNKISWLLRAPGCEKVFAASQLEKHKNENSSHFIVEVGPRLNQRTPFCTNVTSIFTNVGLEVVEAIEVSTRYKIIHNTDASGDACHRKSYWSKLILETFHDPMRHIVYDKPLTKLTKEVNTVPWVEVDVLENGAAALKEASDKYGFGFDDWDMKFYSHMFQHNLKRNPTTVECFDLAQSNSEHSRHWFFKSQMIIDGEPKEKSLFKMVQETLEHSNRNNVIAFHDNGSSIEGFDVTCLMSEEPNKSGKMVKKCEKRHLTLTAETHNFPTGVAPFPGAATGVGGRQRDTHAIGRGSHIVAATAGYCVGNLNLAGTENDITWEDHGELPKSRSLAAAKLIAKEASDGASSYGNQFGEPLIAGFFRAGGVEVGEERYEWLKPIMFSAGIGSIDSRMCDKIELKEDTRGLLVCKIGGPAYSVGVGGGAASSKMQGEDDLGRDLNAVQRGDGEMGQKLNRVVRACIEMGDSNPILSIHDQGAGGNGNVIKEIVDPSGAVIFTEAFTKGDTSMTSLELWTAEYQESDCILVAPDDLHVVMEICSRERCGLDVVGRLTGDGRVVVTEKEIINGELPQKEDLDLENREKIPVDFNLKTLFDDKQRKFFELKTLPRPKIPLNLENVNFLEALSKVLMHPSVGSKRFLTNKVDRSVTGLVAQQQCVGPLHTPLSDVAVTSLSHFDLVGTATSIGEQPMKMLCDVTKGARMCVGESLTNLVFAPISNMRDVKCSANWMWPAKMEGEGSNLFEGCRSMCQVMRGLGVGVDGGKDSLSMVSVVQGRTVKSVPSLVVSCYAPCTDITKVVTPDLKGAPNSSKLVWVQFQGGIPVLGGSVFAHCYKQLGRNCPDLHDVTTFTSAFNMTQQLIRNGCLTSGHDVSDGGLITAALEMSFAGNVGVDIAMTSQHGLLEVMFSEACGILIETEDAEYIVTSYKNVGVDAVVIGKTNSSRNISIKFNEQVVMQPTNVRKMAAKWEYTSYRMEKMQCDLQCVEDEMDMLNEVEKNPKYECHFNLLQYSPHDREVKVAIVREEGSNGDREMSSAFVSAGFSCYDVTMNDLVTSKVDLRNFRGIVFVGGFSYADVLGSAKGWASCCLLNSRVRNELEEFRNRQDTFSFGVCNGCQLMALLGWVGDEDTGMTDKLEQPSCYLTHNTSKRFESRFSTVEIQHSTNSIMLSGMQGMKMGVWVAHGEGKFTFNNDELMRKLLQNNQSPIRYVDFDGNVTTRYPHNPNGSANGIAALCSSDGRHLALMPHPERCFKMWQFPWQPKSMEDKWPVNGNSPWMRMFQNAYQWCKSWESTKTEN